LSRSLVALDQEKLPFPCTSGWRLVGLL
jgi:hypothetical protein